MDERDAFLRMIAANPDDDTPRLVFADWLDEHDEPERAEFIRLQIRLARMSQDDAQVGDLRTRETELILAHQHSWNQSWMQSHGSSNSFCRVVYQRGFPEVLTWGRSSTAALPELLSQAVTIRRLQVRGSIGPRGARDLANCPQLVGLASLDLYHNGIGDKGARALAGSAYLAGLRELVLSDNWITDKGARAIATSGFLAKVASMDLSDNLIGRTTIFLLRKRLGDRVKC